MRVLEGFRVLTQTERLAGPKFRTATEALT